MTGLIIVAALFAIIILLLIASVKVTLRLNTDAYFEVRYLGFTLFKIDPKIKKKSGTEQKKKKPKPKKEKSGFKDLLKDYSERKSKRQLISELLDLIKNLLVSFKKFIKHIHCEDVVFDLTVASDEAGKTAVLYGSFCGAVSSVTSLMSGADNFSLDRISVKTDFTADKPSLVLNFTAKVKAFYILTFAISLVVNILKIKIGEIKNGRA